MKPEAYNPEAYNFVAMLGFFLGTNQNFLPNMELLISEIVVRVLYRKTCIAM